MAEEIVERVARAIDAASQPPGQKDYKLLLEICARAAIEAMRVPTTAMLEAEGTNGYGQRRKIKPDELDDWTALGVWQAMVDEALK